MKTVMTLEALKAFERAVDKAADDLMCTTAEAEAAKSKAREEYRQSKRVSEQAGGTR